MKSCFLDALAWSILEHMTVIWRVWMDRFDRGLELEFSSAGCRARGGSQTDGVPMVGFGIPVEATFGLFETFRDPRCCQRIQHFRSILSPMYFGESFERQFRNWRLSRRPENNGLEGVVQRPSLSPWWGPLPYPQSIATWDHGRALNQTNHAEQSRFSPNIFGFSMVALNLGSTNRTHSKAIISKQRSGNSWKQTRCFF